MKRCSTGTGSPTETEPFDFGTISRSQRAILAAIRVDGPGTEADLYSGVQAPKPESMQALRDDLHVLEDRALVRCEIQPNGRRIWGSA